MYSAVFLALGLSIDGFGVGLSYGLRRIRFTIISIMIITLCTIIVMGSSMLLSNLVSQLLTFIPVNIIGALILFILGGVQLKQAIIKKDNQSPFQIKRSRVLVLKPNTSLSALKNIFCILRRPSLADSDLSGIITWKESFLLGGALSADAFAAGIGAGFSGISLLIVVYVGLCQILMIMFGRLITDKISNQMLIKLKFLPGTLLISIALLKAI